MGTETPQADGKRRAGARRAGATSAPTTAARRILIGITAPEVRARIARAVAGLGCEVVSVADGYHLTERLADGILGDGRDRPSLIIINPILAGCTGLSLLAGLRDLGWQTPVILVVGADDSDGRRQAWAKGVTGVFIDPLDTRELRAFATLVLDPTVSRAIEEARPNVEIDNLNQFAEGTHPGVRE